MAAKKSSKTPQSPFGKGGFREFSEVRDNHVTPVHALAAVGIDQTDFYDCASGTTA
jgi:hypothetical protein